MQYSNDHILIEAIRKKDRKAFVYLYQNYTGQIKNFVRTHGGQMDDEEEIEQNVIIHLYEKIVAGKFELHENVKLSTYMYAVGKNMWYKKLNTKSQNVKELTIEDLGEEIDFYDSSEDAGLENEVVKALQNSDDDCKKILTLYYYDKKSMKEISETLSTISEENLRKRKYKCIQKLKKVLTQKKFNNG
jgi:RNA polymerase sigma factor (sigma-70 family)